LFVKYLLILSLQKSDPVRSIEEKVKGFVMGIKDKKAATCKDCGSYILLVPKAGLEPARLSPLPPQDSVSTKFHHFGICSLFRAL
jgi:hypothetical protein